MALERGQLLAHYRLLEKVGSGGMGVVWKAHDEHLKRPVAVKILPEGDLDEDDRETLRKEAHALSKLNHPNIETIHDFDTQDGVDFIVMEYVPGATLRQRVAEGPLPEGEIVEIGAQIAAALEGVREQGIVHRDVKPGNIAVTPEGRAKLFDFGLAQLVRSFTESATTQTMTATGQFAGTLPYMAPEQLRGHSADHRSDLYSLGSVLYEMATGRRPFDSKVPTALVADIQQKPPKPPRAVNPAISTRLESIILKCLEKQPEKRFRTAGEVQRALLRRASIVDSVARSARLGLVVVAVAALAAIVWLSNRESGPTERVPIVVLPFDNQTGAERLDAYRMVLTQMLVHELTGSPNIRVLPYDRLFEITQGFERNDQRLSSPEVIRAVAEYGSSRFVVRPVAFAVGNTMRMTAEFWDGRSGEAVDASSIELSIAGSAEETLYRMLESLTGRIQEYFKDAGGGQKYTAAPPGNRPGSVAAALHFNQGKNALVRGNHREAIEAFRRCIDADPEFALAHAWLANTYGLLGYDKKAAESSERAARLITPQTRIVTAYFIQANLAERAYDYAEAENRYLELMRLYPDDLEWGVRLANVLQSSGRDGDAIAHLVDVVEADSTYTEAHLKLSHLYRLTGQHVRARAHGETALRLCQALGNQVGEADALVVLGEVDRAEGSFDEARQRAQRALELAQLHGNDYDIIRATVLLGTTAFASGDVGEARRIFEGLLVTSQETQNNRSVVNSLMNIGATYVYEGDIPKALEYIEKSLDQERVFGAYRDHPALRQRAQALANLGSVLIEYGPDAKRGFEYVNEAFSIFESMGSVRWQAQAQMNMGLYHVNVGEFDRGLEDLRAARGLGEQIGHKGLIAQTTYNIGRANFFRNDYQRCLEALEQAMVEFRELKSPFGIAMAQILQAWCYRRLGQTDEAKTLLEDGLRVSQEKNYGGLFPDAYTAFGELQLDLGNVKAARRYFEKSNESGPSESSIEALSNLGLIEASEDHQRGISQCKQAVVQARELQHLHTLARALINLAAAHLVRSGFAEAADVIGEVCDLDPGVVGTELRAESCAIMATALEGLARPEEARAFRRHAEEALLNLLQGLEPHYRESIMLRARIRAISR